MDLGMIMNWMGTDQATVGFLIESGGRIAVLLALTYLFLATLRRSSPTLRHLCLRMSILAALVLPLLAAITPEWRLALPGSLHSAWSLVMPAINVTPGGQAADRLAAGSGLAWGTALMAVWLLGALLVLARVAVGMTMTLLILRRSQPIMAAEHLAMINKLKTELGISREVRVVVSDRAAAPMVWHLRRPTIILPQEAQGWSHEELRMTLLHELAHARRRDGLWIIVGSLLTVIHWYNPLAWWARRRLVIEAEKACDDHVLSHGADALGYAEHLVELMRRIRRRLTPAPLGAEIAGKKQLEGRVMSILGKRRNSLRVKRSVWGVAVAITTLVVLPLAGLQFNAAAQTSRSSIVKGVSSSKTQAEESLPGPDEFVKVTTVPEILKYEAPVYPDSAKNAHLTGTTWVKTLVDSTGKVRNVIISKSSGHGDLDDAAVKAAWSYTYKPATLDGKPIAVWITYKINFTLDESKAKDKEGE